MIHRLSLFARLPWYFRYLYCNLCCKNSK